MCARTEYVRAHTSTQVKIPICFQATVCRDSRSHPQCAGIISNVHLEKQVRRVHYELSFYYPIKLSTKAKTTFSSSSLSETTEGEAAQQLCWLRQQGLGQTWGTLNFYIHQLESFVPTGKNAQVIAHYLFQAI